MKQKLSQRLEALRAELKAGQQMEVELEGRLSQLRATLFRISGAIQVLEELLDHDTGAPDAQQGPVEPRTHDDG